MQCDGASLSVRNAIKKFGLITILNNTWLSHYDPGRVIGTTFTADLIADCVSIRERDIITYEMISLDRFENGMDFYFPREGSKMNVPFFKIDFNKCTKHFYVSFSSELLFTTDSLENAKERAHTLACKIICKIKNSEKENPKLPFCKPFYEKLHPFHKRYYNVYVSLSKKCEINLSFEFLGHIFNMNDQGEFKVKNDTIYISSYAVRKFLQMFVDSLPQNLFVGCAASQSHHARTYDFTNINLSKYHSSKQTRVKGFQPPGYGVYSIIGETEKSIWLQKHDLPFKCEIN